MNQALSVYCPQLPLGSLDAYIAQVNQIPLLTCEEEQTLAKKLHSKGDLQAAQKLVLSHLRYVVRIAKGYMGYGLPLADLVQEGTVGLMKAVRRFDPDQGVRLVSFAVHWIKAEIHEFILKNWRIVKVATTKAQRKLFFNLRKAKNRLGWFTQEEVDAVAADLGVKPTDVRRMEERLNARDTNFDTPSDVETGFSTNKALLAPAEYLETPNADPALCIENSNWEHRAEDNLKTALERLDPRSQDIITQRWLMHTSEEATDNQVVAEPTKTKLKALAEKYQLSTERIRQIEQSAIKKLRKWIEVDMVGEAH
ncbi:MAG: polymerase sigma-32 factor [Pseudomonadota bacterium]|jgi:RNA polymerase sigma-32 factor